MNRDNLEKLADLLETVVPPPEFHMTSYIRDSKGYNVLPEDFELEQYQECGTVACACGHGPMAGIPVKKSDDNWAKYSERVFDLESWSIAWDFLFHPYWVGTDNTPKGAAARIRLMLDQGSQSENVVRPVGDHPQWLDNAAYLERLQNFREKYASDIAPYFVKQEV